MGDDRDDEGGDFGRRRGWGRGGGRASGHDEEGRSGERIGVPGKATLSPGIVPAHPLVLAERVVLGAKGAAARIEAMTRPLAAAIAAADYLESGRLAFEIRAAYRVAARELAQLFNGEHGVHGEIVESEAEVAEAQLHEAMDAAALLLRAAPRLDEAGAGTEAAEQAWRARWSGDATLDADDAVVKWRRIAARIAGRIGLRDVEVRAGDDARRVTEAKGAQGVALDNVVYLHPERTRPGTADGDEVLAHELVHVAQAALPRERDHGRDVAEGEAAELARELAGGGGRAPAYFIDLARPAADRDAPRVPTGTVDAAGYVDRAGNAVRINEAIQAELALLVLPDPPAPRLSWKDSAPFRSRLARAVAQALGRAAKAGTLAARLEELTYPVPVLGALDGIRIRNASQPVESRVLGPDVWQNAAGRVIADAVITAISESVVRLGAQYVATVDDADRRRAADGWESAYVLLPGHPMDVVVAAALLGDDQGKSVLAVAPAPKANRKPRRSAATEPAVERGWRAVTVRWQGAADPSLWNWLRAEPADATAEEVAAALYDGDTSRAAWLTAAPPYFALDPRQARTISGAAAYRPTEGINATDSTTAADRSVRALTTSTVGDLAALAQGADVDVDVRDADVEAALADTAKQLVYLTDALLPWGLVGEMAPAFAFEARCRAAMAGADAATTAAWGRTAVAQERNLRRIAAAVAEVAPAATPGEPGPIADVLAAYARAAGAAHLAATGDALFARAQQQQRRLASEAAIRAAQASGAAVDDARAATAAGDHAAVVRGEEQATAIAAAPSMWRPMVERMYAAENAGDKSRAEMRRDRDELTREREAIDAEVRRLRADAIAGRPADPDTVDDALTRAAELDLVAKTRAIRIHLRELEHATAAIDRGLLSKVVDALDGKISSIAGISALIRGELDGAEAMLHITGSTAHQDLSAAAERAVRREALTAAHARLERIGGLPLVVKFLEIAPRILRDHQFRVALLNLAVAIGIGFGAAAAGAWAARTVAGVEGATGALGVATNIATEAVVNTTAGAILNAQPVGFRELVVNAIAGAASRLVVHAFVAGVRSTAAGAFGAHVWTRHGARLVLAKGLEIGGEAVLQIAISYAASMAGAHDVAPTQRTVDDWMLEGLGIALGRFVHGRVERMSARLHGLPDEAAAELRTEAKALAAAAAKLEAAPDLDRARELLDRAQALAEREQAVLEAHLATAAGTARTNAAAAISAAKADAAMDTAEVANLAIGLGGFREVIPGAVYEGSPDAVLGLVAKARGYGIEVIGHDPTLARWTFRHGRQVIRVDEVDGPAPRFDPATGQTTAPRDLAGAQRRRELDTDRAEHHRDLRRALAEELGVPVADVRVRERAGAPSLSRDERTGVVTATFAPGTAPAAAIEVWTRQAAAHGVRPTAAGGDIDVRRLTPEQEDAARWQAHGIEGDPAGATVLASAESRMWFGLWMSQPVRFDADGNALLPAGAPAHVVEQLQAIKAKGNIAQTTKALAVTERLAERFEGLDLDPDSAGWKAQRSELVAEFGEAAIRKYEKERGVGADTARSAAEQQAIQQRLDTVLGGVGRANLVMLVPDADVYVTGGAPRADKDPNIADLDLVVVVPEGTPHRIRVQLEDQLHGRTIELGDGEATREIVLDPKVMTPAQFAGWSISAPSRGINVRVSMTSNPVAGRAGADLHDHVMGVPDTDYYIRKVGGGSAVATLERAWQLANDTTLARNGVDAVQPTVHRLIAEAIGNVERAIADGQPNRVVEARARRALDQVLAANDRVPFDHTYDLRDYFVTASGGIGAEQFAADVIAMQAARGTAFSEQSVSVGKLERVFDPATMGAARAESEATGNAMDLRFLAMMPTTSVLSAKPSGPDIATDLKRVETQLARKDVMGIDIAGPESLPFTAEGMKRFEEVYRAVEAAADARGRPLVLRPHVGEGYDPIGTGDHAAIAARNLELLVATLEDLHYKPGGKVVVRFGHATHATPTVLDRIAALGVIVEANVGSNLATGSIARAEDHPLLYNAFADVKTVLATDGEGVMGTDLQAERRRAEMQFADFKAGKFALEIDGKAIRYADIKDDATRKRFDVAWLDEQMKTYRDSVVAGDAEDRGN
jgi:hypothetical protein